MTTTSSDSSLTTTSHTMTACPPVSHSSQSPGTSSEPTLCEILAPQNRHLFITPTSALSDLTLGLAKIVLDKSAGNLADAQAERLKEIRERRKRKRKPNWQEEDEQVLKIRRIHTQGFAVENIWEQARRVIDALRRDVELNVQQFGQIAASKDREVVSDDIFVSNSKQFHSESDDSRQEEGSSQKELDSEISSFEEDVIEAEVKVDDKFKDDSRIENNDQNSNRHNQKNDEKVVDEDESSDVYQEDEFGLNDGFFSIDQFNKQTKVMELDDAVSGVNFRRDDDNDDDDDEIDWNADPLVENPKKVTNFRRKTSLNTDDKDSRNGLVDREEDEEENGPIFTSVDLNAPEGESDDELDVNSVKEIDSIEHNTNDIMYDQFFKPPQKRMKKGEIQDKFVERQKHKSKKPESEVGEPNLERTMAAVKRDLFEDQSDLEDSDDGHSENDIPNIRKSTHELKQAKIMKEIRRLEAASIAPREWKLAGEARAVDRPLNSLLEEDLDFEQVGKPFPEITAETSESIENLIKRRILAKEFDEVIRRRPGSLEKTITRRGLFELDDNKPQQSLAEIYAEEHTKANNPDTYVSKANEKIKKEEREIVALWKDLSAKLDALSSWHFKPKPAAPTLTIISDVSTIAMEDAQPTTASGIAGSESMLAPQEIYKAGKSKDTIEKGDIILPSGIPISRQEMTREQKLRRRRREKEIISKRRGTDKIKTVQSQKTTEIDKTLSNLKIGGVKIIGKKGELRDIEGNELGTKSNPSGANSFKL